MINAVERKKIIPGLKQKSQGKQNVCEILKEIRLKKDELLHKLDFLQTAFITERVCDSAIMGLLFGNKFLGDVAAFVFPPLPPHVPQGWGCEPGPDLLFSSWSSLLSFSRLKDEPRRHDKVQKIRENAQTGWGRRWHGAGCPFPCCTLGPSKQPLTFTGKL